MGFLLISSPRSGLWDMLNGVHHSYMCHYLSAIYPTIQHNWIQKGDKTWYYSHLIIKLKKKVFNMTFFLWGTLQLNCRSGFLFILWMTHTWWCWYCPLLTSWPLFSSVVHDVNHPPSQLVCLEPYSFSSIPVFSMLFSLA